MYLWNVQALTEELRENRVSEKDKMLYVLFLGVAYVVLADPFFSIGLEYSYIDFYNLIALTTITVFGTLFTYKRNLEGDGYDFITRYTCLAAPIGVRILIIAIFVGMLGAAIASSFSGFSQPEIKGDGYVTTFPQVVAFATLTIVYYYWLGNAVGNAAKRQD